MTNYLNILKTNVPLLKTFQPHESILSVIALCMFQKAVVIMMIVIMKMTIMMILINSYCFAGIERSESLVFFSVVNTYTFKVKNFTATR